MRVLIFKLLDVGVLLSPAAPWGATSKEEVAWWGSSC